VLTDFVGWTRPVNRLVADDVNALQVWRFWVNHLVQFRQSELLWHQFEFSFVERNHVHAAAHLRDASLLVRTLDALRIAEPELNAVAR
jgi:hypothetical protein